jgi:hypothetical protein
MVCILATSNHRQLTERDFKEDAENKWRGEMFQIIMKYYAVNKCQYIRFGHLFAALVSIFI